MNKTLAWWHLIGIALIAYALSYVIGGVIGNAFGLLGLICLALGIVRAISTALKKE